MYSYRPLAASIKQKNENQLGDGIIDSIKNMFSSVPDIFQVKKYWAAIKSNIASLQNLGQEISAYQQKIGKAYSFLVSQGRQDLADQLRPEAAKADDDMRKWWTVKGYIDKYAPEWAKAEQSGAQVGDSGVAGLGIAPLLIIAPVAAGALAYVVTTGMALLQDYAFKSKLSDAVIAQKMTSGQAADILSVPPIESAINKVIGNVGSGLGIGLPIIALLAAGVFFTLGPGAVFLRRN